VPSISPKLGTHDGKIVPDDSSYSPVLVPKLLAVHRLQKKLRKAFGTFLEILIPNQN
jgi:hypothetical protein